MCSGDSRRSSGIRRCSADGHSQRTGQRVIDEMADQIAGAGINMAQRVMDCGDAGHILLSNMSPKILKQYRQWRRLLHDLGTCEVKHGVASPS